MATVSLPNNWQPRLYQRPLWDYLERGGKRAIGFWHRRAGKDDVLLNRTAVAAFERPAAYWTALPEYAQARKAIWTAVDPHTGKRRIDQAFPHEVRDTTNEQEMFIRFKNGSTWQLVGSDRYDSLVGSGVAGVTFSEFALANPSSWGYIRPMLEENNGWAAFITTLRGNNHAKALYDVAKNDPRWFAEVLSVTETGELTEEQQQEARVEYQAIYGIDFGLALFNQEYFCDFSGAMVGAYWGAEVNRAEREGRIKPTEIDWAHPVAHIAAPDCLLWLWGVNPMLPQALETMQAWGFTFVSAGSWSKRTESGKMRFGPGYWLRSTNEPYLIGRIGNPKIQDRGIPSGFDAPAREHSRKPEMAYGHARRMAPHVQAIDLFSRQEREGFDCFGNEVGKFQEDAA